MKRLVIFCDGTWNRLSAKWPTNVVRAASAVLPVAPDGTPQLVYYGEGIGTTQVLSRLEVWAAGAFGLGLDDKILDPYRFLIFNYVPGDEIYIFGFSRGAYTARSLAGLIRKCGILTRDRLDKLGDAMALYRDHDASADPDGDKAQDFRLRNAQDAVIKSGDLAARAELYQNLPQEAPPPVLSIRYVGVWDTVGALGIPRYLLVSQLLPLANQYRFYDTALSSFVEAARHAVAIDETRKAFAPTLWANMGALNELPGRAGKYLQQWFPGDHGSVGGGGDITGLSAITMGWIMEGAQDQGLCLNAEALARVTADPDPLVSLHNSTDKPGWTEKIYSRASRHGLLDVADVGSSARTRFLFERAAPPWEAYRPETLAAVAEALLWIGENPEEGK
ncbi:MAG TPA: DUF2235 domain-containing protein [Devosiaceae bacterium]|jgi:uncharacterized protein (DUF2235 family)